MKSICTQALAGSQTFIFEERERLLALQSENESLRLQEAEDRARIRYLAAVVEAGRPEGIHPRKAMALPADSHSAEELKLRLATLQHQMAEQVDPLQQNVNIPRIAPHLPSAFLGLLSMCV